MKRTKYVLCVRKNAFLLDQDQEVAYNDDTYLSVVACVTGVEHAEQRQELETAEKIFELIARRGPSPGPRALVRVGVAYAQVEMWDKALSVFEAIVSYLTRVSHSTQL